MDKNTNLNKRIEYIDLLRVYFCAAILTYHIGILKGGYLAVCSFLALSGYFSAYAFKKEDFSVIRYYKTRIVRVYLPMILVVFCTLALCDMVTCDGVWVSMKREVTSLLLGYNNFWQLSANLDYFARHVDSPYMHLWYVAILLQLELVFPLLYAVMKDLGENINKYIPVVLCFLLGIGSIGYFVYINMTKDIMHAYYNTFTRCFSWILGIAVGLYSNIKEEDKFVNAGCDSIQEVRADKKQVLLKISLLLLICIQTFLFIYVGADNTYYVESMIVTTVLACFMLQLSGKITKPLPKAGSICFRYISDISYEIFLVQYPVIYLLQGVNLTSADKTALTVVAVLASAAVINFIARPIKNASIINILKVTVFLVLFAGTFYGGYKYVVSKDLQAEMERLERQMAIQEERQRIKQQEYEAKLKEEQERLKAEEEEQRRQEEKIMKQLEQDNADIDRQLELVEQHKVSRKKKVTNLYIVFVGDSVLLGASDKLYDIFPNCYIDAEVSRTAYSINEILESLKNRQVLGDYVVINCGANGDCPNSVKDEIMETLEGRQVFWLTSTNNQTANDTLAEYAGHHDNLHVIDWKEISSGHSEYFAPDGIHLEIAGREAYAQAIIDGIYAQQIEELEEKEQRLLEKKKELEEQEKELSIEIK